MSYFGIIYVFAFLPTVILLYSIMPKKLKPFILLLASYGLIIFVSHWLTIFLILSSLSIYLAGIIIQKMINKRKELCLGKVKEEKKQIKEKYQRYKKIILLLTLLFNISFLFYFKYLGFFSTIINYLFKSNFTIAKLLYLFILYKPFRILLIYITKK